MLTDTTRLFSRSLWAVAYVTSGGTAVYGVRGFEPPAPARVSQLCRRRFGIETSYRQMNQCRARTCTRDPAVRLLLVGVALVLRNVWVRLYREVLSGRRRGRRTLRPELLSVKALPQMLPEAAVELFDVTDTIRTRRPIPDRFGT